MFALILSLLQVISSSEDIRSVAPVDRQCYFGDEKELEFYEKYTFINCQMECAIREVEKDFKCIPWYLPKVGVLQCDSGQCMNCSVTRQMTQELVTPGLLKTLK